MNNHAEGGTYQAMTGSSGYDSITWSAPPISRLVAIGDDGVQAIRHLGAETRDSVRTRARDGCRPDALLLARQSHGMIEMRAGDEFRRTPLARDLCCYLPAEVDAEMEFPASSQALILHFPRDMLRKHAHGEDAEGPLLGFRDPQTAAIMEMVEQEMLHPGFAHDVMLDGMHRCIAARLARQRRHVEVEADERIHISPARLRRVVDHVEANLAGHVSLKDLAAVAGVSMFHFSRVFKKAVGQTPHRYLSTRRLMHAQMLLADESRSIVDISLSCGFSNQSHFTNAFLKEVGMPPGRYRRTILANQPRSAI